MLKWGVSIAQQGGNILQANNITISIEGNALFPSSLIPKLPESLKIGSQKRYELDTNYAGKVIEPYGWILLGLPHGFTWPCQPIKANEKSIINFLENYHDLLMNNGVTEILVSYQIFYTDDDVGFELFNTEQMEILGKYDVHVTYDFYKYTETKIREIFNSSDSDTQK
jgi:hypothetical protein